MSRLFNVRLDDDLFDAIDDQVEVLGITKSVWAREVLGSVALGGVTLDDLRILVDRRGTQSQSPHPPSRVLALQGQVGRREQRVAGCLHPPTAIQHLPFTDVCTVCGDVVRRR